MGRPNLLQSITDVRRFCTKGGESLMAKQRRNKEVGSRGTGLKAVVLSTLSAAFGVQKKANQEKDFREGNPAHFAIAGIVGTALLIAILLLVVHAVLGG